MFYPIIGIVIFILFLYSHYSDSPNRIGRQGEKAVENVLRHQFFWGLNGIVLRNLYLPKQDNTTTEIDIIFITKKGIFVIESKNYSGYIFGSESRRDWVQTLYAGETWFGKKKVEKHYFYNPIWQNNTHIKCLRNILQNKSIPIFSVIVFSTQCSLMDISFTSENLIVCKRDKLKSSIGRLYRKCPDALSLDEIENVAASLSAYTNKSNKEKKEHIDKIKEKQNNNCHCPLCGGNLVLRTAKRGPYIGNQFYGCSNYPKCKYTKAYRV